jgi:hypothetical protein
VPHVAHDDHRREMWIDLFGTHDHLFALSWLTTM